VSGDEPSLAHLETLATSEDVRDRAFATSVAAMRFGARFPERVAALCERARDRALSVHAEVRERIRRGALDAAGLVEGIRSAPIEARDHLVEEILDVAYPPAAPAEVGGPFHACPSGTGDALFAIEQASLDADRSLVDLGSGRGKVVLLAAALTGARGLGIEIDARLVERARAAAASLGLTRATFEVGDVREVEIPAADVYFMFIPALRSTELAARLEPIAARRRILLFSQALEGVPWLRRTGAASHWVVAYEGGHVD
jgi:SAM-dependent methyltransferase